MSSDDGLSPRKQDPAFPVGPEPAAGAPHKQSVPRGQRPDQNDTFEAPRQAKVIRKIDRAASDKPSQMGQDRQMATKIRNGRKRC
jgi:hypothetical protein